MKLARTIVVGALVVLAAGCATTAPTVNETSTEIDQILSAEYEVPDTKSVKCLSTTLYDHVDVIDDSRLLFRGLGKKAWVNNLRHRCPGLRDDDTLLFEVRNSQACSLDRVSQIDPSFNFWTRIGPSCTLGEFQAVSPDQLAMIDDVLRKN